MTDSTIAIHDIVQKRYGDIASNQTSCCGPADSSCDCNSSILYDTDLLMGLPEDVTNLSLGCGNPVTIASIKAGETVLDLGSGGGIDCFLAARQVGESGQVIGVDMTPAMLEKANANKARIGANNVEFRAGKIEALPVDDNSVDLIMSNCVINLSPDKQTVFNEAVRVLKPGGRVSISDIVTEGVFSPELQADKEKWAECVTGAIDLDEYTGMMEKAGFMNIQVEKKVSAEAIIGKVDGMPLIYSANITAIKPTI